MTGRSDADRGRRSDARVIASGSAGCSGAGELIKRFETAGGKVEEEGVQIALERMLFPTRKRAII
ncbi:MAG TPA: hypothetical protein VLG46_01495 [Anaerolineae bacterium]|nr:hypothetical protein [Anaerolineae bacterium]